jgi:hypothetical protein
MEGGVTMARAAIFFEDTDDGVVVELSFEDALPDDPADATPAQMESMVLFTTLTQTESAVYNDGESEEAAGEV